MMNRRHMKKMLKMEIKKWTITKVTILLRIWMINKFRMNGLINGFRPYKEVILTSKDLKIDGDKQLYVISNNIYSINE
jgi:sRNA-binding regulator protein Hfq